MPASCQKTSIWHLQINDELQPRRFNTLCPKTVKLSNTGVITNELQIKPKLILVLLIFQFFLSSYFLHYFLLKSVS